MQEHLLIAPETFPWPIRTTDTLDVAPEGGSLTGLAEALTFRGLTPAERCAAVFVADGMGGSPAAVRNLAAALEVEERDALNLLWSLLRKGFLTRVAYWWSA